MHEADFGMIIEMHLLSSILQVSDCLYLRCNNPLHERLFIHYFIEQRSCFW